MELAMDDIIEIKEPGRYDLFLLTQAYNRGEISLEEWLARTRAWAEAVIARAQAPSQARFPRAARD